MKISVTKVRKIRSTYIDLTDEALSATIDIVTITEHKVNFLVEMSDGRSYESTTTVAGTDSYCMGIDSPINDISKFSEDIQDAAFPDLVFYDDYDEYAAAEERGTTRTAWPFGSCTRMTARQLSRLPSTTSSSSSLAHTRLHTSEMRAQASMSTFGVMIGGYVLLTD